MTTQLYTDPYPSFDFIRPEMTVHQQLQQWKAEYLKLYNQLHQERNSWEQERSQGLLLLNDYRRDNQQLEVEKRQWEQEREFGFKLVENLRQRVDHYIMKIQLIEKFYNIDISKLDNTNFVKQVYKDHMTYDPNKIDYVKSDEVTTIPVANKPNSDNNNNNNNITITTTTATTTATTATTTTTANNNISTNNNYEYTNITSPLNEPQPPALNTVTTKSSEYVEDLYEDELNNLNLPEQARKLFDKKRRESEYLRKECQNLERELKNLRRKKATKKKKYHNKENIIKHNKSRPSLDFSVGALTSNNNAHNSSGNSHPNNNHPNTLPSTIEEEEQNKSHTSEEEEEEEEEQEEEQQQQQGDELLTAEEAQIMIAESDLLSELMDAWSMEVTNLLEQIAQNENNENSHDNGNETSNNQARMSFSEWKPVDLQQMADKVKMRMADKSKQALEKHRTQRTTQDESEEEKDMDNAEKRGHKLHGSRIVLSKLTSRRDTSEMDPSTSAAQGTEENVHMLKEKITQLKHDLEEMQHSKILLILQTSLEMDRMRELLKSYNPSHRYRRILDELLEGDRYQKLLDKMMDDSYEPHEMDALLAHIAHLKHRNF